MRDRYYRLTLVMDIATVLVVAFSAWVIWNATQCVDQYTAKALADVDETRKQMAWDTAAVYTSDGFRFLTILILALAGNLAVRVLSWIWIGRFWR